MTSLESGNYYLYYPKGERFGVPGPSHPNYNHEGSNAPETGLTSEDRVDLPKKIKPKKWEKLFGQLADLPGQIGELFGKERKATRKKVAALNDQTSFGKLPNLNLSDGDRIIRDLQSTTLREEADKAHSNYQQTHEERRKAEQAFKEALQTIVSAIEAGQTPPKALVKALKEANEARIKQLEKSIKKGESKGKNTGAEEAELKALLEIQSSLSSDKPDAKELKKSAGKLVNLEKVREKLEEVSLFSKLAPDLAEASLTELNDDLSASIEAAESKKSNAKKGSKKKTEAKTYLEDAESLKKDLKKSLKKSKERNEKLEGEKPKSLAKRARALFDLSQNLGSDNRKLAIRLAGEAQDLASDVLQNDGVKKKTKKKAKTINKSSSEFLFTNMKPKSQLQKAKEYLEEASTHTNDDAKERSLDEAKRYAKAAKANGGSKTSKKAKALLKDIKKTS